MKLLVGTVEEYGVVGFFERRCEDVGVKGLDGFIVGFIMEGSSVSFGHFHSKSVLNYHYFYTLLAGGSILLPARFRLTFLAVDRPRFLVFSWRSGGICLALLLG